MMGQMDEMMLHVTTSFTICDLHSWCRHKNETNVPTKKKKKKKMVPKIRDLEGTKQKKTKLK